MVLYKTGIGLLSCSDMKSDFCSYDWGGLGCLDCQDLGLVKCGLKEEEKDGVDNGKGSVKNDGKVRIDNKGLDSQGKKVRFTGRERAF